MEGGFFTELARTVTSSVIAIGSVFFSYISSVDPYFESPSFFIENQQMCVSIDLQNWFTSELDEILSSGKTIRLHFTTDIIEQNSGKIIQSTDFFHTVTYHILDDYFEISRSEAGEKLEVRTIKEMHQWMSRVEQASIFDAMLAKDNVTYQMEMSAKLPKIKIEGMEKPLDMMSFWKGEKPRFLSPPFDYSVFVQ